MEHYQVISCPDCGNTRLHKNGKSRNGTQRWKCLNEACSTTTFQLEYTYIAHQRGIKAQIEAQTLNSSGVRDIARNLSIK